MSQDRPFTIRDYLDAKFEGVDDRFDQIEKRLGRIEGAGPRAGAFGAVGTVLGGAVVAILAYLGIRPGTAQ